MDAQPFEIFGESHIVTLLLILALAFLLPLFIKNNDLSNKVLLTEKRIFFEVSFFWGIGGGINALITPDIPKTFPDPQYILFFIGHGLLIIAIAYACIALKNRPTLASVKNGIYVSLSILPIIYVVNMLLGPPANYWYLGTKPIGESILDFFPEPPLHIPLLIIIGAVLFFIIYSPYWIYDKFKRKDVG